MISLSIVTDVAAQDWIETPIGWQCGENHISVIPNRCLQRTMLGSNQGVVFIAAEKSVVIPSMSAFSLPQFLAAFAHISAGDGVLIWVHGAQVTIVRTAHATIPLYVSGEADRFNLGWDYNGVVAARRAVVLSRQALRCFIVYGPQLAQDTIVLGVKQLFAGQKASWGLGQLQTDIDMMAECDTVEQSVLKPGADVSALFVELINMSCGALLQHAARPALELSGGLDSACIGVALKAVANKPLHSYALLHGGTAGHQQRVRREELLSQLDCRDVCVSSSLCKPFTRLEQEPAAGVLSLSVYEDLYGDGFLECLKSMPDGGPDLVITGIGGDELTMTELSDATMTISAQNKATLQALFFYEPIPMRSLPATGVSQSALSAAFVRAPLFLHHAIWPKNPFIDPRIAQFAQMLPPALKQNRLLNRLTLARSGLSDYFIFPRFKENFKRVFMDDLMDFRGDTYWRDSLLHSHMIANAAVLSNAIRDLQDSGSSGLSNYIIINAVRAEYVVRAHCRSFGASFDD